MDYRRALALGMLAAPLALASVPAAAAIWGSFSASRIAYVTGTLTGDVHSMLRGYITDHGDTVADPTSELTPEYLATVDVFYTAMLSDGTGPTAGALGTLILTPDSNGFEGPFPIVYDSWTSDYGVTDYAFVFGPGTGQPIIDHPITTGLISYSLDGTTSFTYPATGQILGTAVANDDPFLVLFEPATGFDVGGRMLVVADHNALTDGLLDDLGNQQLAQNIVSWAAGECGNAIVESVEECDDGNLESGDGCDATCISEGEATGTGTDTGTGGSESTGDGLDDTAGSSSGAADDLDPLPPESSGVIDTTGDGSGDESEDTSAAPAGDDESGCSCGSHGTGSSSLTGLLLALGLLGRRRVMPRARR